MPTQPSRATDLPWLTAARLPAAVWVLLYHTWSGLASSLPPGPLADTLGRCAAQGGMGVAFFYMLSGFILTHVYGDRQVIDRRRFFLARFARIWPVYAVSLLVAIPILVGQFHDCIATHGAQGGLFRMIVRTGMSLTFLQAWSPNAALFWNVSAWSLSCEAFFYLVFPWLLPRMRRLDDRALLAALAICMVPMVGRFVLYRTVLPNLHLNFNPLVRLPEFVAGIALGLLFSRGLRIPGLVAGPVALAAAIAVALPSEALWRMAVLHAAFLAGILWMAARTAPVGNRIFALLILLGQASYSLYLLHAPIFELLPAGWWNGALRWSLSVAAVVALSVGCYRWIETPARSWITTRSGRPKGAAAER